MRQASRFVLFALVSLLAAAQLAAQQSDNARTPTSDAQLRYWLDNMVRLHGFTTAEVQAATGLPAEQIEQQLARFEISAKGFPETREQLLVVPYPGGRHPRIGFLEGAIDPQRETKISVFTPWARHDYVVVDVPEAIFSNLGLTYLAHTHVPTLWTRQEVALEQLEWNRREDGTLDIERKLPNGIRFGSKITPQRDHVRMQLWLENGTAAKLTGLRVQNCVMLKAAAGFNEQTNDNKLDRKPYAVCKSQQGNRWIITGWQPLGRVWFNPRCPCLHADPVFPDCPAGERVELNGWLSFYEGSDIDEELKRIDSSGWREP